jgi:hypothetical protein
MKWAQSCRRRVLSGSVRLNSSATRYVAALLSPDRIEAARELATSLLATGANVADLRSTIPRAEMSDATAEKV